MYSRVKIFKVSDSCISFENPIPECEDGTALKSVSGLCWQQKTEIEKKQNIKERLFIAMVVIKKMRQGAPCLKFNE
jgi:hypothetical protein